MNKVALCAAMAAAGWAMAGAVPARASSGLASYDAHTDSLVTAARYEPRGSVLRVVEPRSGRSVLVTVNDRGPFNGGRILDLSTGAFRRLFGGLGRGVGHINYEVVHAGGYVLASRGGYGNPRHYGSVRHFHRHHRRHHYWR